MVASQGNQFRKPVTPPNRICAESTLCAVVFSMLFCAIRFIVTVEIASVFGVTERERKVAKKQEKPEMARTEKPEN
jgi:hypothetical protein